jgi:hypothetical protein
VRALCKHGALEICDGDIRTFALGGFAAHTLQGAKVLVKNREGNELKRLPSEYTETECLNVSNEAPLCLRTPGRTYGRKRMNQLLWRVDVLQTVLKGNWVL